MCVEHAIMAGQLWLVSSYGAPQYHLQRFHVSPLDTGADRPLGTVTSGSLH